MSRWPRRAHRPKAVERAARGGRDGSTRRSCRWAIAAAAPFPNPPRALVGPDGFVVLREWRLVFEWAPGTELDRLLPRR